MKQIVSLLLVFLISITSMAASTKKKSRHPKRAKPRVTHSKPKASPKGPRINYLTDAYMSEINLQGLQIIASDGVNEFRYKIRPIGNLDFESQRIISTYARGEIISRIYELDQKSAFQNVYVCVGQLHEGSTGYVLNVIFVHTPGAVFANHYDILNAGLNNLTLLQYKSYGSRTGKIKDGILFPSIDRVTTLSDH